MAVSGHEQGFESPFGTELLATVDGLLECDKCEPSVAGIREDLRQWPAGAVVAERKCRLFDDRAIGIALECLVSNELSAPPQVM